MADKPVGRLLYHRRDIYQWMKENFKPELAEHVLQNIIRSNGDSTGILYYYKLACWHPSLPSFMEKEFGGYCCWVTGRIGVFA